MNCFFLSTRLSLLVRRGVTPLLASTFTSTSIVCNSKSSNNLTLDFQNNRSVIVSHSDSIYSNLSIEDWIFDRWEPEKNKKILLVWRDDPCVVLGKFQSPWIETNVSFASTKSIAIARRRSGGGAVYHDPGNLNLSFITHKSDYDRKHNLSLIVNALNSKWPQLELSINQRDDILLKGIHKVSGSAAKLTRTKAYHHCTLLVESKLGILHDVLSSSLKEHVETKASESVPCPTENLSNISPTITPQSVLEVITNAFLEESYGKVSEGQIYDVTADDATFPGIEDIINELQSWDWIYGKTPKFTLNHVTDDGDVLTIVVEKGIIQTLTVTHISGDKTDLTSNFFGVPFCPITIGILSKSVKDMNLNIKAIIFSFINKVLNK